MFASALGAMLTGAARLSRLSTLAAIPSLYLGGGPSGLSGHISVANLRFKLNPHSIDKALPVNFRIHGAAQVCCEVSDFFSLITACKRCKLVVCHFLNVAECDFHKSLFRFGCSPPIPLPAEKEGAWVNG